jgi:hypothetical protein
VIDREQDKFEAELRRIAPANPPEVFMARLLAAGPPAKATCPEALPQAVEVPGFAQWLRWLIPATAAALVVAVVLRAGLPPIARVAISTANPETSATPTPTVLKADDVRIRHDLISSFDAVARLPGGEPVRFRFQQWMDQVVLSDSAQGLVVESRTPRVEVVPVRFETY